MASLGFCWQISFLLFNSYWIYGHLAQTAEEPEHLYSIEAVVCIRCDLYFLNTSMCDLVSLDTCFSIKMYNLNWKLTLKFYKLYVGGSILRGRIAEFCAGLAHRGFYKA